MAKNYWPGNIDGMVTMPRLGKSGPTAGGAGQVQTVVAAGLPIFKISGYADGILTNPFSGGEGPIWDGSFPNLDSNNGRWMGMNPNTSQQISGGNVCQCYLRPSGDDWRMLIGFDVFNDINVLWSGTCTGSGPAGVYVCSGFGVNTSPPTFTVVQITGNRVAMDYTGCSS